MNLINNNVKTATDFWDELPDEVKASINEAKAQLDRGEGIPHEEVMADIKKRFLKS